MTGVLDCLLWATSLSVEWSCAPLFLSGWKGKMRSFTECDMKMRSASKIAEWRRPGRRKAGESRREDEGNVWKKGRLMQRVPLMAQASFNGFYLFRVSWSRDSIWVLFATVFFFFFATAFKLGATFLLRCWSYIYKAFIFTQGTCVKSKLLFLEMFTIASSKWHAHT